MKTTENPPVPKGDHQAVRCAGDESPNLLSMWPPPGLKIVNLCGHPGYFPVLGPPRADPGNSEKITSNSIRPKSTKLLPKWFQSDPKVTQVTPESDLRIRKWDL